MKPNWKKALGLPDVENPNGKLIPDRYWSNGRYYDTKEEAEKAYNLNNK